MDRRQQPVSDSRPTARQPRPGAQRWLQGLLLALLISACGGEEIPEEPPPHPALPVPEATSPRPTAEVVVAGFGTFRIELLPAVAPLNVAAWIERAEAGEYDGTTFHRVVPDFVIQGGDPNTRDRDPRDDGLGCQYALRTDEYSEIGHRRGIVGVANLGRDGTGTCQWFVVTAEEVPDLDGFHTIIGHVTEGIDVALAIEAVEVDTYGRHGPQERPLQNVVIERVRVEHPTRPEAGPEAAARSEPTDEPARAEDGP